MRLLAPATGAVEVGTDRNNYRGRIIEVSDRADIKELRAAGYTAASVAGSPVKAKGFDCTACGFRAFFRRCGRCGHTPDQCPDTT